MIILLIGGGAYAFALLFAFALCRAAATTGVGTQASAEGTKSTTAPSANNSLPEAQTAPTT